MAVRRYIKVNTRPKMVVLNRINLKYSIREGYWALLLDRDIRFEISDIPACKNPQQS
jgi:hypothetical protein